jgi:hypothetical protein
MHVVRWGTLPKSINSACIEINDCGDDSLMLLQSFGSGISQTAGPFSTASAAEQRGIVIAVRPRIAVLNIVHTAG